MAVLLFNGQLVTKRSRVQFLMLTMSISAWLYFFLVLSKLGSRLLRGETALELRVGGLTGRSYRCWVLRYSINRKKHLSSASISSDLLSTWLNIARYEFSRICLCVLLHRCILLECFTSGLFPQRVLSEFWTLSRVMTQNFAHFCRIVKHQIFKKLAMISKGLVILFCILSDCRTCQ